MAKMRKMDILEKARNQAIEQFDFSNALKVSNTSYAIETYVDVDGVDTQVWVEINFVVKNYEKTDKTDAYDGDFMAKAYLEDIATKEKEKAEKEAKKTKK